MTSDAKPDVPTTAPAEVTSEDLKRRERVVIYCRVSTDDSGQTNKTQEFECRKFCESMGFEVMEVYRDEETGTSPYREDFGKMMLRVQLQQDVDYIVAYDQSRITRGDDIKKLKALIEPHRCAFKFVRLDIDDSTIGGRITQAVQTEINAEENRVRNEKTRLGMQERVREGKHVGRPARIMFAEDKLTAPTGRYKEGFTVIVNEDQIYGYARKGYSLYFVANEILEIPYNCLINEMHEKRPGTRYTGPKDRFSEYMTLCASSKDVHKGSATQRVGNEPKTDAQRVVVE